VSADRLRMVHVRAGDTEGDAACCALGVSKKGESSLELLVYGKDKEPLIRVPLKPLSTQQENPIEATCEVKDDNAVLTLKFLGKYAATFELAEPR
jgi:hypothetical protein